jgi:hypothetical protein
MQLSGIRSCENDDDQLEGTPGWLACVMARSQPAREPLSLMARTRGFIARTRAAFDARRTWSLLLTPEAGASYLLLLHSTRLLPSRVLEESKKSPPCDARGERDQV